MYPCMRYEMMVGMLRSPTATNFSWWLSLEVMLHHWEEASLLQKRVPPTVHLGELTQFEWKSEVPESEMDEALT